MRHFTALLALLLALPLASVEAAAPGHESVREQVEASMLVTGSVDIAPDGTVSGYELDKQEELPREVIKILAGTVPEWRFKPVLIDGVPSAVRSRTSIRLQAKQVDEDNYLIEIAGVHFGSHTDADVPTSRKLRAPSYPAHLALAGVGGTVYLILKIARDGAVEDVMSERVDLVAISSEPAMRRMRDGLERAALGAARKWVFAPPVSPDDAPFWLVRVPVEFIPPNRSISQYGEWQAYVPGPRQENPWSDIADEDDPATLVAGGTYPVGQQGPELLTPLRASRG